jgi:hypothetical protein
LTATQRDDSGIPLQIPELEWIPRSDWVDVRGSGAAGDGMTDDTVAIQKVLDNVKNGSNVYFPPGVYRITRTLRINGPLLGVTVIGHGRETTLIWDGDPGGVMFADDGVAYSRFVGLQFDGRNRASIGFHHDSHRRFETEVRHQYLAFRNFTNAGVLAEPDDKFALAETLFESCLFENCRRGVAFVQFNDYNYTFDGCEFRFCHIGIQCDHGNFYARNCHFEQSSEVDIHAAPEHASSVRRCTSVGSRSFIRYGNPVAPMTIQDCHVSDWISPEGAITLGGAPVLLFDCVFIHESQAPVQIRKDDQRLIVSGNQVEGSSDLIQPDHRGNVYMIPPGKRQGSIVSAYQRFLKDTVRIPRKVFDARRDFGAQGDGKTDDTDAIQKTIDAAREHGEDAIAYLPTGIYVITSGLRITGRNYFVGGSGNMTRIVWRGAEGGTMITVHDPQNVVLEHISAGVHDSGDMNNGIDILQTGSGRKSHMTYDGVFVYGMYQKQPFRKGLQFQKLGEEAVAVMPHVQGNIRFLDCGAATILANCSYEGSVVVEGMERKRGGLLGFQTRLSTITTHGLYLKDNHSIIMSDFYVEQADDGYVFEGSPETLPGRATIQGAKVHFTVPEDQPNRGTAMTIQNYSGEIFFGPNQLYVEPSRVKIRHTGEERLDLFLLANCFYKTTLDVQKSPAARVFLLANQGVALSPDDQLTSADETVDDNLSASDLERIAMALDDLRRLGELDLKINHQNVIRNQ